MCARIYLLTYLPSNFLYNYETGALPRPPQRLSNLQLGQWGSGAAQDLHRDRGEVPEQASQHCHLAPAARGRGSHLRQHQQGDLLMDSIEEIMLEWVY